MSKMKINEFDKLGLVLILLFLVFAVLLTISEINKSDMKKDVEQYSCEDLLDRIQQEDSKDEHHIIHVWIKKDCWRNYG